MNQRVGRPVWWAVTAASVVLVAPLTGSAPAGAQATSTATASGTQVRGTLNAPSGQPASVFVLTLPASTPLGANVAALVCDGPFTTNLTGGPNGTPECVTSTPVDRVTFTLTGIRPWADVARQSDPQAPSFQVPWTVSLDGHTYENAPVPLVVMLLAPSPATAPAVLPIIPTPDQPLAGTPGSSGGGIALFPWAPLGASGVIVIGVGMLLLRQDDQEARDQAPNREP
jgi:hypothetical protein